MIITCEHLLEIDDFRSFIIMVQIIIDLKRLYDFKDSIETVKPVKDASLSFSSLRYSGKLNRFNY